MNSFWPLDHVNGNINSIIYYNNIIFEILSQLTKCLGYLSKPDSVLDSVEIGYICEQNKCNSCPLREKKNSHFHKNLLGIYFLDKPNTTLRLSIPLFRTGNVHIFISIFLALSMHTNIQQACNKCFDGCMNKIDYYFHDYVHYQEMMSLITDNLKIQEKFNLSSSVL